MCIRDREWIIQHGKDNTLQLINSGDDQNFFNLTNNVSDFQVNIHMQDGTIKTAFSNTDQWTDIKSIEMFITTSYTHGGETETNTWSSQFFPRNILSNQ